jgi:hypothetical protein
VPGGPQRILFYRGHGRFHESRVGTVQEDLREQESPDWPQHAGEAIAAQLKGIAPAQGGCLAVIRGLVPEFSLPVLDRTSRAEGVPPAIANGHALAAVLGNDAFRDGARQVFVTGSFWFSAVPMAAAIATIAALGEERAVQAMERSGAALREGILAQARSWDLSVNYTGPAVMPYLSFAGDDGRKLADVFAAAALRGGVYLHPRHNWFVSAAMTGDDIARALEATDHAFAVVRKQTGNPRKPHE